MKKTNFVVVRKSLLIFICLFERKAESMCGSWFWLSPVTIRASMIGPLAGHLGWPAPEGRRSMGQQTWTWKGPWPPQWGRIAMLTWLAVWMDLLWTFLLSDMMAVSAIRCWCPSYVYRHDSRCRTLAMRTHNVLMVINFEILQSK